jgi:erythrocyte band 7 integral membrane protein
MHSIGEVMGFLGSIPCVCCCPNPYKEVKQGYVGLVSRYGEYYKTVDPGLVKVNPISEELTRVDIKMQVLTCQDIAIMTKDNVNITIDCVVYWYIVDVYRAQYSIADVRQAIEERAQTSLRAILGAKTLQECIENRETIAEALEEIIAEPARSWGVRIESTLIKDLQFSADLKKSLASAATQKRIGESKVIAAQAEVDAAKLMREAADILNTEAAMQIRYLDTVKRMAETSNAKVIFMPMPTVDANSGNGKGKAPLITPEMIATTQYMD